MKIYYFTDPMCSWCYGFSPVVKKLKEDYQDIDLEIISGGFSPFSQQVVDEEYKAFLKYHWNNVHERSGQYFDHAMKFVSESFRYDTEPSSRALVVIRNLLPLKDFEYLSLLQEAFYADGKDITNPAILAGLAEDIGVDRDRFLASFCSEDMKQQTLQGFQFSRQLGVQGFPSLLTLEAGIVKTLTRGYLSYDSLKSIIDDQLKRLNLDVRSMGSSCMASTCNC